MKSLTIHDIPMEERPRERMQKHGAEVLSMVELLAILIGSGTRGKTALQLASELLSRFEGIEGLLQATIEEMAEIKGMGRAKASYLKAAFALAIRCQTSNSKPKIESPDDAYLHFQDIFYQKKKEVLAILLRDVRGKLIHKEMIAMGSLTEVVSHPREIFHSAVRRGASSLILAHNHPSGDPRPSKRDLELTKRIIVSGSVLGIPLDDHLILGKASYVSLWKEGIIQKNRY